MSMNSTRMKQQSAPAVDFIGLGAQKAGTTWLFRCLEEHPAVRGALLNRNKELNFFSLYWEYGCDWYDRQFTPGPWKNGEFSTQYLPTDGLAERMRFYNPKLRLIAALRDPVARALSQHRHLVSRKLIHPSTPFDVALERNPSYIDQGRYTSLLRPYYDRFPSEQIHIVMYDDIVTKPGAVMRDLYSFLRVDVGLRPRSLTDRIKPTAVGRRPVIDQAADAVASSGRRMLGPVATARVREFGVERLARLVSGADAEPGTDLVTPEIAARIRSELADDLGELSTLIGRTVPAWAETARHP